MATQTTKAESQLDMRISAREIPASMRAVVYRGVNDLRLETVPVPVIGPGELLVKIATCGVCGTDLKKISTGSHSAPRIFGHEMAGTIVQVGEGVSKFRLGERVMVFHHIPCGHCYYCRKQTPAQCAVYKKVGATAGMEPSGGGFAEYIRVMNWIVEMGGVIGQGPIGVMLAAFSRRTGARVLTSDLYPERHTIAAKFGLNEPIHAGSENVIERALVATDGRGADVVILAVGVNALIKTAIEAVRPGGKVMLFAQTQHGEAKFDPGAVCMDEKSLLGSYSASTAIQPEVEELVFGGYRNGFDLTQLISHRFPLEEAVKAIAVASHPQADSMKIMIEPVPGAGAERGGERWQAR
ncbi:MAG: alcohol dehydrogenase catalytic domain-containing protein [Terracidiphilus sp.]